VPCRDEDTIGRRAVGEQVADLAGDQPPLTERAGGFDEVEA
jgi:hypothetical protein